VTPPRRPRPAQRRAAPTVPTPPLRPKQKPRNAPRPRVLAQKPPARAPRRLPLRPKPKPRNAPKPRVLARKPPARAPRRLPLRPKPKPRNAPRPRVLARKPPAPAPKPPPSNSRSTHFQARIQKSAPVLFRACIVVRASRLHIQISSICRCSRARIRSRYCAAFSNSIFDAASRICFLSRMMVFCSSNAGIYKS